MTGRRLVALVSGVVLSAAVLAATTAAGIVRWRRRLEDARKVAETHKVIERLAHSARVARARGLALPATISLEASGSVALLARASCDGLSVVAGSSGELGSFG
jgi:hypothetical protein